MGFSRSKKVLFLFGILAFSGFLSGCACIKNTFCSEERPRYRGVMSPNRRISEDDFATLRKWNANLLRKQFNRNWVGENVNKDIPKFYAWVEKKCAELDKELPVADKYGIKIILDMHTPPGGRLPGKRMCMYYEQKYADAFINLWKKLAKRYKGEKRILAFDLINEPVTGKDAPISYWELQIRAAKAIREIDPERTIIFEVDGWDGPGNFKDLKKVDLDNIVYQVHMYEPFFFTHQGVGKNPVGIKYPGRVRGKYWSKKELEETLKYVREFQLKYNVPIYAGEFSAINWADGAASHIADCISIFEEYKWHWSFHAFREWHAWSVEYVGDQNTKKCVPSEDNPRKRALLKGFELNKK